MRITVLRTVCASLLVLGASMGAWAGTDADPEIVDQAGDANHLHLASDPGTATGPASVGAVDLLEVWFSTTYVTVKDRDTAGRVTKVRNIPQELVLSIRTAANKNLGVGLGGYELAFSIFARGTDGCALTFFVTFDPQNGAPKRNRVIGCHTGPLVTLPSTSLRQIGPVATYTVPLADAPFLAGMRIQPGGTADPTSASSGWLGNQVADKVAGGRTFVVGQDVPPDIDCEVTPQDPACA